jgi:predicted nucleic acid-binding protein
MAAPVVVRDKFLVIDASLAVKLVLPEPFSEEALAAVFGEEFSDHLILAPMIVVTEVAAAITKAVRTRLISPALAREAYDEWTGMAETMFGEIALLENMDAAFELSLSLHHSMHDCLYLALAEARGATLATCDAVLAEKARSIGATVKFIGG